MSLSAR